MIKAKLIFSGQKRRYGNYFREWDIETDCSKEETLAWCFNNLDRVTTPERAEWLEKQKKPDGTTDYSYYFRGYHTIKPIDGGFRFTVCEPYAD